MTSFDAKDVIADAIRAQIPMPTGRARIMALGDEELALKIIEAIEAAGFKIVSRDAPLRG